MGQRPLQDDLGRGDGGEHPGDDRVGVDVVGQRLVGQHQAVPQHVEGQLADVRGQHVVAAAQERERPGAQYQGDRGARAGAVGDVPLEVAEPDAPDGLRVAATRRTAYSTTAGST